MRLFRRATKNAPPPPAFLPDEGAPVEVRLTQRRAGPLAVPGAEPTQQEVADFAEVSAQSPASPDTITLTSVVWDIQHDESGTHVRVLAPAQVPSEYDITYATLMWAENYAVELECELSRERVDGNVLWKLTADGPSRVVSRRDYARVSFIAPVIVVSADGPSRGSAVDLSESGLLLLVEHDGDLPLGTAVLLQIALPDRQLETTAVIVRSLLRGDSRTALGVCFDALTDDDADLVRRTTFAQQMLARKRAQMAGNGRSSYLAPWATDIAGHAIHLPGTLIRQAWQHLRQPPTSAAHPEPDSMRETAAGDAKSVSGS